MQVTFSQLGMGHHLPLPNLGVLCITDVACSLGTLVTLVFETGNRVSFPEYFGASRLSCNGGFSSFSELSSASDEVSGSIEPVEESFLDRQSDTEITQ